VPADRVVITVGDLKITAGQFDQIVLGLAPQYQAAVRGAGRKQFAEQLARVLLLAQEGKRRKLDESPSYQTQTLFQNANVLAGMTYDQLGKDAKLEEADVRKYYDEHKRDFDQVRARHILIRMQGSPLPVKPGQKDLTEAEALAKAQELRKRVVEGHEEFEAVARVESDDNGSGANGGDLGFFHHGQMVPAFEEAAFAMKPGEISQPVKSQFGYHVIKLESVKAYDELRPDVERKLRPEIAQKALTDMEKKAGVKLDPEYFPAPPPPPVPPAATPAPAK
jgi:peptidyl-prolyl cis-trans isomerase C